MTEFGLLAGMEWFAFRFIFADSAINVINLQKLSEIIINAGIYENL